MRPYLASRRRSLLVCCPVTSIHGLRVGAQGSNTQCLMSLVPNTINRLVLETSNLKYWVVGPCGGTCKQTGLASPGVHQAAPCPFHRILQRPSKTHPENQGLLRALKRLSRVTKGYEGLLRPYCGGAAFEGPPTWDLSSLLACPWFCC